MGRISINSVNEARVQAIVQAELVLNPPSSQLPTYATAPSGFSNGQMYRNTTDGLVYIMTPQGFKAIDYTVDSFEKILLSGTSAIILASEHNLTSVSGIKVYSPSGDDVLIDYNVNVGLTVTVSSEINLNNYKLKIFS